MTLSRRKFITLIGGGTIVAAGGAAAGFATTRTPNVALAPWSAAGGYEDPRKWALSYAILAPNAHNRQPWQVDLRTPDQVIIWRDTERDLPETDPYHRQLVISIGCFLEQMRIAAAERGVGVTFDHFPEGEDGPVAIAHFKEGATPDPLFPAIANRRSCKEPFTDQTLTADQVTTLQDFAIIKTDSADVEALKALTWDAWQTEVYYPPTHKESVDLMRLGKAEINATPDGIDLGGTFLESLMLAGLLTRDSLIDTESTSFRQGALTYQEMLNATPAYAVLTSKGNSRADQLDAGRQWLRLNLKTTEMGLALHPVSQALQEYPQMADHYTKAHEMLANPGETVQMLGRVGYGPQTPQTPRWPLETVII
ncbi:MAG: twin-arginine translocation pathway signal protein [Pseudomonadota bacterium]